MGRDIKWNPLYCIVDVPSSKRGEGNKKARREPVFHNLIYPGERRESAMDLETAQDLKTAQDLETALNLPRSASDSKKRLLAFKMIPKQLALRCYATTEASERVNLKDFLERHSRFAKYATDGCSMIQNYWESELHLSYYQLRDVRRISDPWSGIIPLDSQPFPGSSEMRIVRAAAGFRFHGDFFDRHWTCYVLDSDHNDLINDPALLGEKRSHRQRKVLEQRYFADILKSLTESVDEILKAVNERLGVKSGSFSSSIHTTNEYLAWNELWQKCEPLLQKLHADLASTQTVVLQWEAREEDRGKEKPRWTSKDERKYRTSIVEIRREIKRRIGQLQYLHETTKSLQDLCSGRLNKAREDLTFRNEQNIAMFTYVTVIFLPLGFAASIFSINGVPETSLVINMVVASTVALAVTIIALMNAKALASVAEKVSKKFEDFTVAVMKSSARVRHSGKPQTGGQPQVETFVAGDHKTALVRDPSAVSGSYLTFWMGYLFIELPARAITSACRTLGWWPRDSGKVKGGFVNAQAAPGETVQRDEHDQGLPHTSDADNKYPSANHNPSPRGRFKPVKMLARVILGFLTLPLFLATWIIQILCLNAWDALALLGGKSCDLVPVEDL